MKYLTMSGEVAFNRAYLDLHSLRSGADVSVAVAADQLARLGPSGRRLGTGGRGLRCSRGAGRCIHFSRRYIQLLGIGPVEVFLRIQTVIFFIFFHISSVT